MPTVLWIVAAAGLLAFCTWTINTDAIFEKACDLDTNSDTPIHECMLTLMILSLGWLSLALSRGRRLKKEVDLRKLTEVRALSLAREDALTGLLNRRAFMEEVETAIARPGESFSLLLIDLDDFKAINDIGGHAAGDAALQSVARRLAAAVGERGMTARLGGDEFAALVSPAASMAERRALIEQLAEGEQPMPDGSTARVGASVGAAVFPLDAGSAEGLLQAADTAMYSAKRDGGRALRFFDPVMEAERGERRRREEEFRLAIVRDEVRPFYQPILALDEGAVRGFEVLARWLHPRLGLLGPGEFIALAEATGQITAMTESLLRQTCRDIARFPAPLRFAINVSPAQFSEPRLAERLIDVVRAAGVSPDQIEIELTEVALMSDSDRAAAVIDAFRANGMTVALDDFGTGYSGLSNLRRLKFDKLKIDRSFVGTMLESDESRKLVEAILDLGRSFGLAVTAEGIEDEATLAALAAKGCALGQGYLFGKPMPFEAAAEFARVRSPLAA